MCFFQGCAFFTIVSGRENIFEKFLFLGQVYDISKHRTKFWVGTIWIFWFAPILTISLHFSEKPGFSPKLGAPNPWISCFDGSEMRQCLKRGSQFWNFENRTHFRSTITFFHWLKIDPWKKVMVDQKRVRFSKFHNWLPLLKHCLISEPSKQEIHGLGAPYFPAFQWKTRFLP